MKTSKDGSALIEVPQDDEIWDYDNPIGPVEARLTSGLEWVGPAKLLDYLYGVVDYVAGAEIPNPVIATANKAAEMLGGRVLELPAHKKRKPRVGVVY